MLKQLMNLCRKTLRADSNSKAEENIKLKEKQFNVLEKESMRELIEKFEKWKIEMEEESPYRYRHLEKNELLWKVFIYGDFFPIVIDRGEPSYTKRMKKKDYL